MVPIARTALPGGVEGVKTAVGQVVPVPISVVAAPRGVPHHVGDVGDEFRLFVEQHGHAHAAERGVRRVEVVVPKLVAGVVSVGGEVKDEGALVAEALVGAFDEVEGRFNRVAREASDQKEAVLASGERLHGFAGQRSVVVRPPVIGTDGAVVRPTEKGQFLVEAGLVVAARNTKRYAFGRHEVVEAVHRAPVLEHLEEGRREVRVELISINGLPGGRSGLIEHEHAIEGDVSRCNERPPDGLTFF